MENNIDENDQADSGIAHAYCNSVLPEYFRQVEKFIRDAPSSLRHDGKWLDTVVSNLTMIDRNNNGKINKPSPLTNIFFSQKVLGDSKDGRNLITGEQLLGLEGHKSLQEAEHISTGIVLRTTGKKGRTSNQDIAMDLIEDSKTRGIKSKYNVILDFYMLDIKPSQDPGYGLALKLNDLTPERLSHDIMFPWYFENDKVLTYSFLVGNKWFSSNEDLNFSSPVGAVVGYSANGSNLEFPTSSKQSAIKYSKEDIGAMQNLIEYKERLKN